MQILSDGKTGWSVELTSRDEAEAFRRAHEAPFGVTTTVNADPSSTYDRKAPAARAFGQLLFAERVLPLADARDADTAKIPFPIDQSQHLASLAFAGTRVSEGLGEVTAADLTVLAELDARLDEFFDIDMV